MQAFQRVTAVPPRIVSRPTGGFRGIPVAQIYSAWLAYRTGLLKGYLDFRVYLALHEIEERRLVADRVRAQKGRPRLKLVWERNRVIREVRKFIGGKSDRLVAAAIRRLHSAELVRIEPSGFSFGGNPELLSMVGLRERRVPVPRHVLRYLAKTSRPCIAATVLGYLLKCVRWRKDECHVIGRCKGTFIAHLFDVDARSVKRARKELRRIGWLIPNAGGSRRLIPNLTWPGLASVGRSGARPDIVLSPKGASPGTEMSPSTRDQLRSGSKKQQALSRSLPGIRRKRVGNSPPQLSNVQPVDLSTVERLEALFEQAATTGLVTRTAADRLRFFAAAARALRLGSRNPCGFFVAIVRRGLWHFISQVDEDRALELLRTERNLAPGPAKESPTCRASEPPSPPTSGSGVAGLFGIQSLVAALVAHCSMDKGTKPVGHVHVTGLQPAGLRRGTLSAVARPPGDERSELGDGR